jgi:hypothetical protein
MCYLWLLGRRALLDVAALGEFLGFVAYSGFLSEETEGPETLTKVDWAPSVRLSARRSAARFVERLRRCEKIECMICSGAL